MSLAPLMGLPGKVKALLDRLTATRAGNLDNLNTTVSSRAAAATALSTANWTNTRAGNLDRLDATVASRASQSSVDSVLSSVGGGVPRAPSNELSLSSVPWKSSQEFSMMQDVEPNGAWQLLLGGSGSPGSTPKSLLNITSGSGVLYGLVLRGTANQACKIRVTVDGSVWHDQGYGNSIEYRSPTSNYFQWVHPPSLCDETTGRTVALAAMPIRFESSLEIEVGATAGSLYPDILVAYTVD